MKYKLIVTILLTFLFSNSFSQKSLRDSLKGFTVTVVQKAMKKGVKKIAVWDFTDINKEVSLIGRYVAEQFSIYAEGIEDLELMDRQNLKSLLNEHQLKSDGFIDKNTIMELGKLKDVQAVAVGSVILADKNFQVVVKIIETSNGRTVAADEQFFPIDKNMAAILGKGPEEDNGNSGKQASARSTKGLAGLWSFTIYSTYVVWGDGSMKNAGAHINGFMNLVQNGNSITGKFSLPNSADFKDGDINGTIKSDNLELEITCTKGPCINTKMMITGKYNNGSITGKIIPPQSNQPLKCRIFVGPITIKKQDD